ncbi:uncharacterized protein cubi_00218 [Cryptosporidium ubiquitum]|uniref:Peptidase A1 domain-containing protein n=1 Tax=Cryptosporidium ubiquitum TaxID=857276 RepID=A0A1J4MKA4_9CRYT|nr:uncharacterized protein cubi_00218 [Cryptosporidium ubiquitum]OII74665.1 hypothetical protein cubi_00218 [Cryptosporidium ubiquitum]
MINVILHIELVIKLSIGYFVIDLHSTGDEKGYYFIHVFVGNPPQKQSLILDSGSSQISFTCITCSNCGMHDYPPFDITKSTTGKSCNRKLIGSEKCTYFHRFNEGSIISGKYFSDIVSFENIHEEYGITKDNLKIKYDYLGCNELETKKIYHQNATGVFGIGLKSTMDDRINIINFLLTSIGNTLNINDFNNIVISICLLYSGGKIKIGEYNEKIIDDHLNLSDNKFNYIYWIPILYPSNLYKVRFEGISIGNGKLSLLDKKKPLFAIIDIGSTFSFLPTKVYNKLFSKFSKICEFLNKLNMNECITIGQSLCLSDPIRISSLFPTIKIKFGGQENLINWLYTSYLIKRKKAWCIGIKEQTSDQNRIILGISFLKNKQIILDPRKKRIGIGLNDTIKCKDERN